MTRNKTLLLVAVLTALAAGTAFAATQSAPAAGASRPALDKNGDGAVDRAEAAAHPRLAERFDTLDKNKDGKLSAEERPHRRHGMDGGHRRGSGGHGGMMKQLDTDGDGRISKAEAGKQPRFAEHFARMDANGDGYVDAKDRELRGKQRRDEWFAGADTDKDGKLTRAEIDTADANRRAQFQQRMQARGTERFTAADANKDGRISRDEAKGKSRLAERFDQLDANKDGFLSQDELKRRSPR
ncbi:calcium-binding protein [Pseudoxanthomonas japonensis]|nr:calcium-binding protein [Pseudoxanthomonas japonensis]